jgi:DNA-binding PadR family transcriptional regulator
MTSYLVLGTIRGLGEATPYDIKHARGQYTQQFWSVPHAMLYSEPTKLAKAGLLHERQEQTGRRRKLYTITDAGEAALDAWLAEPPETMYELREPGLLKIYFGADPQMVARAQLPRYQAWLADLTALRPELEAAVAAGTMRPGPLRALLAGIDAAEQRVATWKRFLEGEGSEGAGV